MKLRYWRFRLRLAGIVHRRGSTGHEWRCRLAEALHRSYEHGMSVSRDNMPDDEAIGA